MKLDDIVDKLLFVWMFAGGYFIGRNHGNEIFDTATYGFIGVFGGLILSILVLVILFLLFKRVCKLLKWILMYGYEWGEHPPPVWRGQVTFVIHYIMELRFLDSRYRERERIEEMLEIPRRRREEYENEKS